MIVFNRREFSLGALGLLLGPRALGAGANTEIGGVKIGAITYSFREVPRLDGEDFLATGLRGLRRRVSAWGNSGRPWSSRPCRC
jgi:hypothetical protein